MAKRPAEDPVDGEQAYLKRSRISKPVKFTKTGPVEEVKSGKQLQQLLTFDQDQGRSKHGKWLYYHTRGYSLITRQVYNASKHF